MYSFIYLFRKFKFTKWYLLCSISIYKIKILIMILKEKKNYRSNI